MFLDRNVAAGRARNYCGQCIVLCAGSGGVWRYDSRGGNIPGKTTTLSVAIYSDIQIGHDAHCLSPAGDFHVSGLRCGLGERMDFQAEHGYRMNFVFQNVRLRLGEMELCVLDGKFDKQVTGTSQAVRRWQRPPPWNWWSGLRKPAAGRIELRRSRAWWMSRATDFGSARGIEGWDTSHRIWRACSRTLQWLENIDYGCKAASVGLSREKTVLRVLEINRLLDRTPASALRRGNTTSRFRFRALLASPADSAFR